MVRTWLVGWAKKLIFISLQIAPPSLRQADFDGVDNIHVLWPLMTVGCFDAPEVCGQPA